MRASAETAARTRFQDRPPRLRIRIAPSARVQAESFLLIPLVPVLTIHLIVIPVFVLILLVVTPIILVVPVLIIQLVVLVQRRQINTGRWLPLKPVQTVHHGSVPPVIGCDDRPGSVVLSTR